MNEKYVVISEVGLAENRYGATIGVSESMTLAEAKDYARNLASGRYPEIFARLTNNRVFKHSDTSYFVVTTHQSMTDELARFTVVEDLK